MIILCLKNVCIKFLDEGSSTGVFDTKQQDGKSSVLGEYSGGFEMISSHCVILQGEVCK